MRLSKQLTRRHEEAEKILQKDVLTNNEKWFVLQNWREVYQHNTGKAGAFFTPHGLARDFTIEVPGSARRILDLCAGIGTKAFITKQQFEFEPHDPQIVCIEQNPDYVRVGKKLLPEATWCHDCYGDRSSTLSQRNAAGSIFCRGYRSHKPFCGHGRAESD